MDADKLLTLWRDYQTQLAKHGDVPHTRELFFAVADAVGISLLEPERLERRLEELHSARARSSSAPGSATHRRSDGHP